MDDVKRPGSRSTDTLEGEKQQPMRAKAASGPKPPSKVRGLSIRRYYTVPGIHPFEKVDWERRTARITDMTGNVIFEQTGIEIPSFWSQTATNIGCAQIFPRHAGHAGTRN